MLNGNMVGGAKNVTWNPKGIAVAAVAICFVVYTFYSLSHVEQQEKKSVFKQTSSLEWNGAKLVDIPENIQEKAKEMRVQERTLSFESDGQQVEVFARMAVPKEGTPKINVLLLHGAAFTSQNWDDQGTLGLIAAMGHKALAVDLPGYGKTARNTVRPAKFLESLISAENLGQPVIVSPSMSGGFSLPYLLGSGGDTCHERAKAFVACAPVKTETISKEEYKKCQIPVMIFYGSKDTGLGHESLKNLRVMPQSRVFEIKDGGHPAYLDSAYGKEQWARDLYNFLKVLNKFYN